jgi:hypothetical protein
MLVRVLIALILMGHGSWARAQSMMSPQPPDMGTTEQRAACGSDVGRFCKSVKPEDGSLGYLTCLTENKEKISERCRKVLEDKK